MRSKSARPASRQAVCNSAIEALDSTPGPPPQGIKQMIKLKDMAGIRPEEQRLRFHVTREMEIRARIRNAETREQLLAAFNDLDQEENEWQAYWNGKNNGYFNKGN